MAGKDDFGLTAKQRMCADYYLADPECNMTKAYRKAYPKCSSDRAAYKAFNRLINENAMFRGYINQRKTERSEKLQITSERVLEEIAKMAFANFQDLYDGHGNLIPVHELPKEIAASLQEVIEEETVTGKEKTIKRRYKMTDKKSSLELLGRHLKLFTDKVELSVPQVIRKDLTGAD